MWRKKTNIKQFCEYELRFSSHIFIRIFLFSVSHLIFSFEQQIFAEISGNVFVFLLSLTFARLSVCRVNLSVSDGNRISEIVCELKINLGLKSSKLNSYKPTTTTNWPFKNS